MSFDEDYFNKEKWIRKNRDAVLPNSLRHLEAYTVENEASGLKEPTFTKQTTFMVSRNQPETIPQFYGIDKQTSLSNSDIRQMRYRERVQRANETNRIAVELLKSLHGRVETGKDGFVDVRKAEVLNQDVNAFVKRVLRRQA